MKRVSINKLFALTIFLFYMFLVIAAYITDAEVKAFYILLFFIPLFIVFVWASSTLLNDNKQLKDQREKK